MKAAVVSSYSEPPRYADFNDPVPGPDEVLVHVTAAGLHPIVKAIASGKHYGSTGKFPFIAGLDGVGRLDDGTRVFFGAFGTFAERAVTARNRCFAIPDALDDITVAAMMNPGMGSWGAIVERAQLRAEENVLILGATGSAGQLAVQIARRLGAGRIVVAGRDQQALSKLHSLGANADIALTQDREALVQAFREAISGNRIDVILDYLWGTPAESLLTAIEQKGLDHAAGRIRYVQIGNSAGPTISLQASALRSSGLEMLGSGFGSVSMEKIFEGMRALLQEAARKPFQIEARAVPLRDVEGLWNAQQDARLVFQP